MVDLTPDEIQFQNAQLTRAQWAADAAGVDAPKTFDEIVEVVAPVATDHTQSE